MGSPRLAWRLSPQLYAWRLKGAADDVTGALATLHQGIADASHMGYDGVEFSMSWLQEPGRLTAVAELLRNHGLDLAALFATVSDGADESALKRVAELAGQARSTTCVLLNVATVPSRRAPRQTVGTIEDVDVAATIRVVGAIGARLLDQGMLLCWHPHAEHLRSSGEGLLRVLEATDPAAVAVCLDLGWVAKSGEDCVSLLRACEGRLGMLHLRDVRDGVWSQAVGDGELPLDAIGKQLQQAQYQGWASVELWFDRATRVTRSLRDNGQLSLKALRKLPPWRCS
jgi:sugar phosphate isomerase/epimerase